MKPKTGCNKQIRHIMVLKIRDILKKSGNAASVFDSCILNLIKNLIAMK